MIQVSYGTYDLDSTNGITVSKATGLDASPVRISQSDITNRDGGNIYSRHWGMRQISFEGIIQGSDAVDYFTKRKAMSDAFNLDEKTLTIVNWAGETTTIDCKVIQAPIYKDEVGRVTHTEYRVVVQAEDPFFLGTEASYTATLAAGGGAPIPAAIPMALGASADNRVTIVNGGGASSYASFTISASTDIVGATLTNLATSESFTIDTTISAGDYVEVYKDSQGIHVLKNGVTDWFTFFRGDFFEIIQGNNTVVFTAVSGTGSAQVLFSNPYLTI